MVRFWYKLLRFQPESLGALVLLAAASLVQRNWMWFIAYFCLLANGSYHAVAWWTGERHLDTPKLLHHGAHPAMIAVYCALTIAANYIGFRRQCARVLSVGDGNYNGLVFRQRKV